MKPVRARRLRHAAASALVLLLVFSAAAGLAAAKIGLNSYIDETTEEIYTLSDDFLAEVASVTDPITVTFCAEPDALLNNQLTRYVYIMAREIEKAMPNVRVETCNVTADPTAVQRFRTTSASTLKWNNVIVSTGDLGERYRIFTASRFWNYDSTGQTLLAFDGEYRMANAFLSLTAKNAPAAYFTVGHGERVFDPASPDSEESLSTAAFFRLLEDEGLRVKTVDLDTEEIPDDCVLLIMNGPTEDYPTADWQKVGTCGAIEKIDRYLDAVGSLMICKDPAVTLPVLEEYLTEWGILFRDGTFAESRIDRTARLTASYPQQSDTSYSLLSDILSLKTPPQVQLADCGLLTSPWTSGTRYLSIGASVVNAPLLRLPSTAVVLNGDGQVVSGTGAVVSITQHTYQNNTDKYYSYVLASATTSLTESAFLENGAAANYDVLFSLVRTMSARDAYAGNRLGGLNPDGLLTGKYGGKYLPSTSLSETATEKTVSGKTVTVYRAMTATKRAWLTVLFALPPIVLAGVGFAVTRRRRNR